MLRKLNRPGPARTVARKTDAAMDCSPIAAASSAREALLMSTAELSSPCVAPCARHT